MRPVYGVNLRQALKVPILLSADLHESKRHKYVDRKSKFDQFSVNECSSVPSAVFNSFSNTQNAFYRSNDDSYLPPGCRVYDLVDEDDDQMSDIGEMEIDGQVRSS